MAKTAAEVCLCFASEKRHRFRVYSFQIVFFVCVRHNESFNLAFRTAGIEDTHPTLAAFLF